MRWRRWLLAVTGYLLVAGIVGLSAAAGWFYWDRVQTRGEQAARALLPQLATKEIPEVFAYDYQTVERSLEAAYPLLTPEYRQEFQKSANAQIIPEAKKRGGVVRANVVRGGGVSQTPRPQRTPEAGNAYSRPSEAHRNVVAQQRVTLDRAGRGPDEL